MPSPKRAFGALLIAVSLPALPGLTAAANAAGPISVPLAYRAKTPIGDKDFTSLKPQVSASAPATVAVGAAFQERLSVAPLPVLRDVQGYQVNHIRAVKLRFRISAGATIVRVRLVGGSAPGASTTTAGRVVTVSAPGIVVGGATLNLPAAVIDLRATAPRGAKIVTDVPGTSYADWTVSAIAQVHYLGDHDLPITCFGRPVGIVLTRVAVA